MDNKERKNTIDNESYNEIQEFFQGLFVNRVNTDIQKVLKALGDNCEQLKKVKEDIGNQESVFERVEKSIEDIKKLHQDMDSTLIQIRTNTSKIEDIHAIQKNFKVNQEQMLVICKTVNEIVETIPAAINEKIDLQAKAHNEILFSVRDSIQAEMGKSIQMIAEDNRQRMVKVWVAIGILLASNMYLIIKGVMGW